MNIAGAKLDPFRKDFINQLDNATFATIIAHSASIGLGKFVFDFRKIDQGRGIIDVILRINLVDKFADLLQRSNNRNNFLVHNKGKLLNHAKIAGVCHCKLYTEAIGGNRHNIAFAGGTSSHQLDGFIGHFDIG